MDETRPRNVAMLYCINATAEPSSGGGEATGTPSSFARIVDEKPEGTSGGSAVVGNKIRDLNTVDYDDNNIVTVADNHLRYKKVLMLLNIQHQLIWLILIKLV